ncbi:MAG: xanthine dehydrogenase family protein molybdopterin-binding subunit [Alphaproteobacteria bacterium]|nr:MAG: xanthine dehydrogenase family protein molybdopterin-binding subunit [Alphaproteobacteria bacterium]
MTASTHFGKPTSRIEGREKVTGAAKYAAEYNVPGLVHGFVVPSIIAKGRIKRIETADALAVPGVLDVLTHAHRPKLASADDKYKDDIAPDGSPLRPLYDDRILFNGQPIALVVADELETARHAASLVRVEYEQAAHVTDFEAQYARKRDAKKQEKPVHKRGNAAKAFAQAEVRVEAEYRIPIEHHNPMEPFATTAVWEGDGRITAYDKTQGPQNSRNYVAGISEMPRAKVRVLSPYVGGAFGSGLRPQYQLPLAVMAARALKRSVRVTLTRQQMFTLGYRAGVVQELALGANRDGTLVSFRHNAVAMTSQFEDFARDFVNWSSLLYRCSNAELRQATVKLDQNTPCDMRGPGGTEGMYAIECAMDELAYALAIDPLELRLINYSEKNQIEGRPYSSKELHACYRRGAEKFGWSKRKAQPRSMREGNELVGWGMASGIWEAMQMKASARALLTANGSVEVASATADMGPGTYTMMAQIAAEMLGVPLENVTVKLGDSSLPDAPVEGGSFTTSSVGSAIHAACRKVQQEALRLAQKMPGSQLSGAKLDDVMFGEGMVRHKDEPSREVSLADAMRAGKADRIEKEASAQSNEASKYAHSTHAAVFAEVKIDEQLGVIRVTRVVSAVAAGRILNPKVAGSQIMGALVGGIGMALHEETLADHRFGRFMNHNLAEYHVPVNADIHAIDVIFVEENDVEINPLGVKGVGEIGIVGTAAAIANAVYHASGKRVRDLPITIDKLMRD